MESILIAATTHPFAGDVETGISVGATCGGRPTLRPHAATTTQGVLDARRRRGTPRPALTACGREGRGTFSPGESAHVRTLSRSHPSSAQPTMDSRRRLARGAPKSRDLRRPIGWRSCTAQATVAKVRVWLAARLSSEGGGLTHAAHVERRAREARANATARAATPHGPRGRGSDARGGARASWNAVAEVVGQRRCREAGAPHFTRSGERSWTGT